MNEPALVQACRLLFGEEVIIGEGFLDYLQPAGLKSAFRRRVRETHPDAHPAPASPSFEAFLAVQQAYQILATYLQHRALDVSPATAPLTNTNRTGQERRFPLCAIAPIVLPPPHRSGTARHSSIDRLHQGPLPARPLLFGHFLYYSGLTTWRTITAVLVRQQQGRPRCGELARHLGLLDSGDIARILATRSAGRPFGEAAVALGLLDERQRHALLARQQRQQKKFGAILVEQDLITLRELALLLAQFRRHNRFHGSF